ncbi:MAG: futalosine hydrolase [Candidatus Melainabacteria bacterium]|nr:MAG: futalosine hydrolase [Candidatus Melainabacteria bacterium]
MSTFSEFFSSEKRLLVAVASGGEYRAIIEALQHKIDDAAGDWRAQHFESFSLLQTGVGKANAAGAVTHELMSGNASRRNYAVVLSFGIAGSLQSHVEIGSSVFGSTVVFADEGTPFIAGQDWTSLEQSGWAQTSFHTSDCDWSQHLSANADHVGTIATVSTISGTDEIAAQYRQRTGALAEAMEGAAIAQVCQRLEIPFAELRVISNRCGNRNINKLDIPTSFKRLKQIVSEWTLL